MTRQHAKPKAPDALDRGGQGLWRSVVGEYDLRVDELRVLEDACRTADLVDQLHRALEGQPLAVSGSGGQPRPHPLMVEIRMQRGVLAALLKQLGLPDAAQESPATGTDGSATTSPGTPGAASRRSVQAREAAMARWSQRGRTS